jgi:hypothetical protein
VSDSHIFLSELIQDLSCEHLGYKSVSSLVAENTVIAHGYTAAFLSSVLQGEQPKIDHVCDLCGPWLKNAKNSAFFMDITDHRFH